MDAAAARRPPRPTSASRRLRGEPDAARPRLTADSVALLDAQASEYLQRPGPVQWSADPDVPGQSCVSLPKSSLDSASGGRSGRMDMDSSSSVSGFGHTQAAATLGLGNGYRFEQASSALGRARRRVGVQTDPVEILEAGRAPDEAQAEALRTLEFLGVRSSSSRTAQQRVTELEDSLFAVRAGREEVSTTLALERGHREAAQQQVLCLEHELDGKEAALQVADKALERRELDITQAHKQMWVLNNRPEQAAGGGSAPSAAANSRKIAYLEDQLADRERDLDERDRRIQRILAAIQQHCPGALAEENFKGRGGHGLACTVPSIF